MSVRMAVASRQYQFIAGPEAHTFYACDAHRPEIEKNWTVSDLFYIPKHGAQPIAPVDPDEEIECDYCRSEEGP